MVYLDEILIDRDLLLSFFLNFSRFEFALKLAGFARGDRRSVKPDWDGFAVLIKDQFDKNAGESLSQACDHILDNPPNKQVLVQGSLGWSTGGRDPNQTELEFLLLMIRRVRNNLFHGGKYNNREHEDTARSVQLLKSCLVILDECLRLSPHVKSAFDEATI